MEKYSSARIAPREAQEKNRIEAAVRAGKKKRLILRIHIQYGILNLPELRPIEARYI